MELAFFQTPSFQELLHEDKKVEQFKALLSKFLEERFTYFYPFSPSKIEFSIFQDPETGDKQPKAIVHVQKEKAIEIPDLNALFTREFKSFLAKEINDFKEYLDLRGIQRHFMIIFKLE